MVLRVLRLLPCVLLMLLVGCSTVSQMSPSPTPPTTPSPTPPPTSPPSLAPCPAVSVTWTSASPLPAPPAPTPPAASCASFPLTVSSPSASATVDSPAHVVASASPTAPILDMRVYVDGSAVFFTFLNSMDALIWMSPGAHTLEITAVDKNGDGAATVLPITVSAQATTTVSDIQDMPGWESCSAVFPPSSARAGQICAAGLGDAVSTMTPNQASPALDGKSAKFTMGGPAGYSNELWFKSLGGGTSVSHFTYDLYFYVDNPNAPQALEFDLNQTFDGTRWTWGTECNFNGSGKWDIWDPLNEKWIPTAVDCKPFPANTWIHLVWNFERVNGQAHYISVSVAGVTSTIDEFFQPQANWTLEDINVAFQMDGNFQQAPYTVWLDQVTLVAN